MSAEVLREAAQLMRARATVATPSPWAYSETEVDTSGHLYWVHAHPRSYTSDVAEVIATEGDAAHIASWHPDVAIAVADWLEDAAENLDMQAPDGDLRSNWDMRVHIAGVKALCVARAYLGESS